MKQILSVCLLMSLKLNAYPTLYPDSINTNIKNNTTSNYLADDSSRYQFYVLPPSSSFAKVKGLHTVTANVGFCREISKIQKYNADTLDMINSMKLKDDEIQRQLAEQHKKLLQANEDLAKHAAVNNLHEITALDMRITQIEKRLDDLYGKLKNCSSDCVLLTQDVQSTQSLRMEVVTKRFELSADNIQAVTEYEKKKTAVQSLNENIEQLKIYWDKTHKDLKDLYADFNKMYDVHAKREGGRVAIYYDSQWTENVQRLNKDNPGYNFTKSQTKNANIKASAYSKNNVSPEGSVLSFDVGGMNVDGVLQFGSFPDSFSGNAVLSILSVCPLLHPEWFDEKIDSQLSDMTYGLTVNYDYPVAMKLQLSVNYNLYRMYEVIKKQGTNGGLFSSSSWSDQHENEVFRDSFSVNWKEEDDKQPLSIEKKMAITTDLRRQMLSRLAGYMVMNNDAARMTLAGAVPSTGAMVLSNSLNKTCSFHVYCKGASITLDVMQAIFGSSSTQQNFKQIANVDMTDNYSSSQLVMQPITTTYK